MEDEDTAFHAVNIVITSLLFLYLQPVDVLRYLFGIIPKRWNNVAFEISKS
jgi:hypothetical protein